MSTVTIDDRRLFPFIVKIASPPGGTERFRATGFIAAPGLVITCAHVVPDILDGDEVAIETGIRELADARAVVRARSQSEPGPDKIWSPPDLAVIELLDRSGRRITDHPCARLDLEAPTPRRPGRRRALVAVRNDPRNPASPPNRRAVDLDWESPDEHGLWWLRDGQVQPGMSGGALIDPDRGAIVAVVNNQRDRDGATVIPLSILTEPSGLGGLAEAAAELCEAVRRVGFNRTAEWDGAFDRRADIAWRDRWPVIGDGHFTGRADSLRKIESELDGTDGAPLLQPIRGPGGIGKTALAAAFADRVRHRFPGGRVFHDFRSYGGHPDTAEDALGTILPAVGAATHDEVVRMSGRRRADLWQAATAGRRMLMVWDNVASVDQLEGLLVGGDGCATIVTTRDAFNIEGGRPPLPLGGLDPADATAMFDAIVQRPHPPEQVAELVRRDACLPVLIAVHAREVANNGVPLGEIIAALPDPDDRTRRVGDRHREALFELLEGSYLRLSDDERFAFRVFGAHPGAAASLGSLAAGMDCEVDVAERRMRELCRTGLAARKEFDGTRAAATRSYVGHDMIRDFAAHLAENETSRRLGRRSNELQRSRAAMLDYYLKRLKGGGPDNTEEWFGVESESIRDLAVSETGRSYSRAARWIGYRGLVYNRYDEALECFEHAKRLDRLRGDTRRVAHSLWGIGEVARLKGELDKAERRYGLALRHSLAARDLGGVGNAERGLAEVAQNRGDADLAEHCYTLAMGAYEAVNDRHRINYVRRGLARVAELRGEYDLAADRFEQALAGYRNLGDRLGIAYSLRGLGDVALAAGELDDAERHYRATTTAFEEIDDPVGVAFGTHGLGRTALARGDRRTARELIERAAEVYRGHDAAVHLKCAQDDLESLIRGLRSDS